MDKDTSRSERNLKKLARELAHNYVDTSIAHTLRSLHSTTDGLLEKDGYLSHMKDVFRRYDRSRGWMRNILIIGAGATTNAFMDIHTADNAIRTIEDNIFFYTEGKAVTSFWKLTKPSEIVPPGGAKAHRKKHNTAPLNALDLIREKYLREKKKLHLFESPKRISKSPDFETSLHLLSQFIPLRKIREEIQHLYQARHASILFYEIVAHLLKHRFIDVVVNFNFDELLDQAIEDEIGKGNYAFILSDGDCREIKEYLTDNGLKKALYIKPHGTSSHKSTMRFMKDHYHDLPMDMIVNSGQTDPPIPI